MTVDQAVRRAAADAGLRVVSSDGRTYTLATATSANAGNVATPATDDYRGEEIIVTAQKRVESAQKVPIAITALSQKNLEEQKIEGRSEEHTSELQSLMRISYAVFCLQTKNTNSSTHHD